ncbi:hypothetical protein [Ursidibacter arcticus]
MFKIIVFPDSFVNEWGEIFVQASIAVNEFSESFLLPISYWDISAYQKQWKKSLNNMIFGNQDKAILFTSMYDLKKTNFIHSWIVYREEKKVILQNKILFKDDYVVFSMKELIDKIPNREIYSEDGQKISEWVVDYDDVVEFYKYLCHQNIKESNNDLWRL